MFIKFSYTQLGLYLALLALVLEEVESRSTAEWKTLRENLFTNPKPYPGSKDVYREIEPNVLKDNFEWHTAVISYKPRHYTDPSIETIAPWIDDPEEFRKIIFNAVDGGTNRRSYEGEYMSEPEGPYARYPRNPAGRTGIAGRGLFGRFGPNHGVDVLPTRYNPEKSECSGKSDHEKQRNPECYDILLITRGGTEGYYYSPGAMVDPITYLDGVLDLPEETIVTAVRGFMEKTMNTKGLASNKITLPNIGKTDKSAELQQTDLGKLKVIRAFMKEVVAGRNFVQIYRAYVDDWRNTDHAWKEAVAYLLKCDPDFSKFLDDHITEGDDASSVGWFPLMNAYDKNFKFFASNRSYAKIAIELIKTGEYVTGVKDPQSWGERIKAAASTTFEKLFGKCS